MEFKDSCKGYLANRSQRPKNKAVSMPIKVPALSHAPMECEQIMPLQGQFVSKNTDNFLDAYFIHVHVKETEKSYIFQLVNLESRYSAAHIKQLFSKSKRVVLKKNNGGHVIRKWKDGTFTIYPYQAGIPYYFEPTHEDLE